jgi:hypothetical protein
MHPDREIVNRGFDGSGRSRETKSPRAEISTEDKQMYFAAQ